MSDQHAYAFEERAKLLDLEQRRREQHGLTTRESEVGYVKWATATRQPMKFDGDTVIVNGFRIRGLTVKESP